METNFEHILTNAYKADLVAYMEAHPEAFEEALQLAISNKQPYSWRAAWLLWSCMEKNDQRVHPYLEDIIQSIPSKKEDQQRELFKILQLMKLNEGQEGIVFDICVNVWEQTNKKASVRFNAFKLITKIAKNYPDLSVEIKSLTQDQYMNSLSEAAKKSIRKMMSNLP